MNEERQLVAQDAKPMISLGKYGVQLTTLDDAYRFAKAVVLSGFAPKGMDKPESVLIAVQQGMEIGLAPMQALQSIAVINGRPAIYGDAALAVCRASGELDKYSQAVSGEGDARKAVVSVTRRGQGEIVGEFSVADAKRAGLWGKPGPWTQYPDRMLMFRARGFALRDAFGDYLRGLRTVEEQGDIIDVTPAPSKAEAAADLRERLRAANANEDNGQRTTGEAQ